MRSAGGINQNSPLIMVVDDEESLAQLTTAFLKRWGFRTVAAYSGREAIDHWTPEMDVLLTDCLMPDMLGPELAAILLQRKPSLRTLFMSANAEDALNSFIPLQEGINFIRKPFSPDALRAFLRQAMDWPPA